MSLVLNGTDNSVSGPAVTGSTGGTGTGLYYPTTNQVALSTNGTQALLINASQQVTLPNDASISGLTVGKGNSSSNNSTAFGYQALLNQTGNFNTSLGYRAGYNITSGTENISIGYAAGAGVNAGTGTANINIGDAAGNNLSSGASNTIVGHNAFYANTTGSYNVAIGALTLQANTTASNNTAVGYQAGYTNSTGTRCTFLGHATGYSTTGSYNTFVGSQAGYYVTSGTDNTFVGVSAGSQVTTGSLNTIIGEYNGNQGGLDIRTASNYIVLADGDGNPRGVFNNAGQLIIGGATSAGYSSTNLTIGGQQTWSVGPNSSNSNFYVVVTSSATGVYVTNGGTSWTGTSDATLKNVIEPITNGLNAITALKPTIYSWKSDDANKPYAGLLAQEVETVLPSIVDKDVNEKLGVRYTELIPYLISAIQELNAKVTALEAKLGA